MILSAREISERLKSKADSYASFLLPQGKKEGDEWVAGSVDGEAGKSLKVKIAGAKAGVFADFAGGDKGDLLTLTTLVRKVSLAEAIKIGKEWLGLKDPQSTIKPKKYTPPKPKDLTKFEQGDPVEKYLTDERGFLAMTIGLFRVTRSKGENGPEYALPSYSFDNELINVKYIAVKRTETGKKFVRQAGGCAPALFGWQCVPNDSREIIITEGELDAMTWQQKGFPAVSVPWGAGNDDWIDYEWDTLQQFDTIWLHYDDDKDGQDNVKKVARRLGMHRCLIVKIPGYKDANAALMAGVEKEVFLSAIARSKPMAPEEIKTPGDYRQKLMEKFYPPSGEPPGFFSRLFDKKLGMRPGEVTLWTGVSGHGKSVILLQLMLEAMISGAKVAIASMEMLGEQTLHRIVCQSEQTSLPEPEDINTVVDWLSGKLWLYDIMGNVAPEKLLALMEYSYARHGVTQFVIDSLMKCGIDSNDYNQQRTFLNDICAFARKYGVHINIVAHARKAKDELSAPGKMDVKGSSDIINQPDNIMSIWRNKDKENRCRMAGVEPESMPDEPDALAYCDKQRETGEEFVKKMRFFRRTFLYTDYRAQGMPNLNIRVQLEQQKQIEMEMSNPAPIEEPENEREPQPTG